MQTCRKCRAEYEVGLPYDILSDCFCPNCRPSERRRMLSGRLTLQETELLKSLCARTYSTEEWNALSSFQRTLFTGWRRAHAVPRTRAVRKPASEAYKQFMRKTMIGNQNGRRFDAVGEYTRDGEEKTDGTAEG